MALGPDFDQPAFASMERLDTAVSRGQASLFRFLWFRAPPGSIALDHSFQALLASRFLADLALQALLYAALIATARAGGSAFQAALIGVAFLFPGLALGLFGGAVADALPKRVALVGAYAVMGALCLVIPTLNGTGFGTLLLVIFAVRVLHQVSQPAEASAAPIVATHEELASANSYLSLASSVGEVAGKALLAPLVVRFWGVTPVTVMAGLLFIFSAFRVVKFQPVHRDPGEPRLPRLRSFGIRSALRWLFEEQGAFWMLLLAAMASTVGVVVGILGPQYVKQVLNVDPANAFYVFAPASVGVVAGLLLAPILIRVLRERLVSVLGFTIVSVAMIALGRIGFVTGRFGGLIMIDIPLVGDRVEMAGFISLFLGLGMTLAAAATQTYIGRYVPSPIHGRIFALLGALKDGLAMPQLVAIGAVASVVGVDRVLTVAPVILLFLAYALARYSARWRRNGTRVGSRV